MTSKHKLTKAERNQFTGSEYWYRHSLNREVVYTDGAKHVAEHGGAYWGKYILDESSPKECDGGGR
jgi:hypothetical protein